MKRISGNYVKGKKEVAFDCQIPSSWDELTSQQFATVVQVFAYRQADPFVVSTSLLTALFDAKNYHILHHLPEEELHALLPLTNFLFETRPPLKNPFPKVKIGKNFHYAPTPTLSNIGFGEWCFAYEFFRFYRHSGDDLWRDKLIATLYRQLDVKKDPAAHDFDGDIRLPFNENVIDARAKHFAGLREDVKNAIVAWFQVALDAVAERRPHLFPKRDPEHLEPEPPTDQQPDGRTWLDVFRELLGPKWGTIEQLKYTNAMFVLDELESLKVEYEKSKRKS